MKEEYELIDNKEAQQFEFHIDGRIAKIEYQTRPGKILLIHTEVPEELGGRGIASKLVAAVLKAINHSGETLRVYCPYVKKYMEKHPYWKVLGERKPVDSKLKPKPKEYSNGEVVIIWKPHLCVHSGICVKTLPDVYDPKARPWINAEGADSQALIDQINACPSGALTYRMEEKGE